MPSGNRKKKCELMLANEHASVALASVVYDPGEEDLLVAAFTVATSTELLLAIKAQLEKHGRPSARSGIHVIDLAGGDTLYLRGAGFGYVVVKSSLRKVNARGLAVVFLHKAATDPALVPGDHFYVVATADQANAVPDLFAQRLMSATYHTILPEWKEYLLAAGLKRKLITKLPIAGSKDDFARALRVERTIPPRTRSLTYSRPGSPIPRVRAYKASADGPLADGHHLEESIVYHEVAHAIGPMTVHVKIPATGEDDWRAMLSAIGYWGRADSLAGCIRIHYAAPELDECATPLRSIDVTLPLQHRFSCVVSEFRDAQVEWEDIMPFLAARQTKVIRLDVCIWPMIVCEYHGGGKILRRFS